MRGKQGCAMAACVISILIGSGSCTTSHGIVSCLTSTSHKIPRQESDGERTFDISAGRPVPGATQSIFTALISVVASLG
ncbi:hypothetical protein BGZ61DRAFT_465415 [Ilyonectria robusta]|uniref:uncharacterized protein n=1 Tax=Ilyonectria robusta TaxID=1079257 RepID=UPI001E8CDD5D|nr:uncharacterized protein BGZ61DRAFT_465415 [Ilyonectria robusta]KAH8659480.1 hypothetical protein BGZ61DRAFT_465415 [Ilyonectria robusta]